MVYAWEEGRSGSGMPKMEWAKNGTFSRKKWNGVPVLAA